MIEIPSDFPWREGMLATSAATGRTVRLQRNVDGDGWWRAVDADTDEITEGTTDALAPVFADHPTVGGLLGAVREVYGEPDFYVRRDAYDRGECQWKVRYANGDRLTSGSATEAEALLSAWNARPVTR